MTWHLDRTIFDPEEVRANRASIRLAELRQDLALTAVRLYYERRRLELEGELGPPSSARDEALRMARIEELGAAMEALCGVSAAHTSALPSRAQDRKAGDPLDPYPEVSSQGEQ
jgi:hypothetical protein